MIDLISRDPAILMVCLTAAAGKWIWRTRVAKRGYDLPAMLALFRVALGGFILKPLSASVLAPKFAMLAQRAPISLTMNDWRVWVMVFFATEFAYNWFHRWSHAINWLWATHADHHSPNEMGLPAALLPDWTGPLSDD